MSAATVVVCRGCCCGTQAKHPDVHHAAHLARLRDIADETGGRLRVTGCLGNCERSNTIVVIPTAAGRRAGGRVTWLGTMLDSVAIETLAQWVRSGGPGLAPLPAQLLAHHIAAPGRQLTPTH